MTEGHGGRPLIGRERELDALSAALDDALAGSGRLCLVSGEPGIGKTRLCDELSTRARKQHVQVHWGRCWEAGGAPAYWPWLETLAQLASALDAAALNTALGDGARAFGEVIPSALERLAGSSARIESSPDEARFRFFRAVLGLLRAAAAQHGLVIVLDDLHAADEASLRLLHFLAREARGTRALLLGTYRSVDARLAPYGERLLALLAREALTLSLQRLSSTESDALLSARSAELSPALRAQAIARTQGNPLFLEEMARALQSSAVPEALPSGVRELISDRLAQAAPDVRALCELCAVIGDTIDRDLLARAAGGEPGTRIVAAEQAGLLQPHGARSLRFGHALIREVLEAGLPRERRAALHAAVAHAMVARAQAQVALPHAELAHHCLEAGELHDAVRHSEQAAERALALFAHEEALQLLARAERALEDAAEPALLARVQIALARVHMRRGDPESGRALCDRARAAAQALFDSELLARAALARGLEITAALIDPVLIECLKEALAALPEGDSALRIEVTARLAAAMQPHPDLMFPIGLARQAIASARRMGDAGVLLGALYTGMSAMMDIVDPRERLPLNLETEQLARSAGDYERLLRSLARIAFDHMELGDLAAADARIDQLDRIASETNARRYAWRVPLFRSMRAMMHGRFEESEALLERARVLGHAASDPQTDRTCTLHREGLLRAAERHDAMIAFDPEARAARAAFYSGAHWQNGGSAFTCARTEDVVAAERYLALVPQDDWPLVHNPPAFMHLGEPLALFGAPKLVEHVYALLLPARDHCLSWGYTKVLWDGPASRVLGLLAARLQRWDEAEAHFELAARLLQRLDAQPYLARTRYEHGRMLLARGQDGERARAIALIEAARGSAESLGMPGLLRLSDRALHAQARTRLSALPPAPRAGESPLSCQQEGELWRIALHGETIRLRDSLGLQYLARLVGSPGQPIHALELAQGAASSELSELSDAGDAGEQLDAQARARYKARLHALREALAEAEAAQDVDGAERARSEMTFLAAELSRAVGLGGKSRRVGQAGERARSAVQRRIKSALERVREQSTGIADWLESTIKTGTYCEHRPELAGRA